MIDVKGSHLRRRLEVSQVGPRRSRSAIVTSLAIAMFFSPCIEIEAYYFAASALGWLGILTVSIVYLVITVFGMVILVELGLRGTQRLNWNLLQHHEKRVTGLVLVFLGIFAYLFRIL